MAIELSKIKKEKTPIKKKKDSSIFDFLNKDISLGGKKINDKIKEAFYSELSVLLSSGIDIKMSLEIIIKEQKKKKIKTCFQLIFDKLIEGKNFSDSILETGAFTKHEYYSLKIGEESGRLINVLNDLSAYFNRKIKQNRQIVSTFTYPIIVIVTAMLAVIFMMNFIVPMFVDIFKRFDGELPGITKWVMELSESINNNIGSFFFILLTLIIVAYSIRKKPLYRKITTGILLKIPLFGSVINKIYTARFCQSMALLTGAKTPMLNAIQLVKNMINFYPYEQALEKIEDNLLHGYPLNYSMEQSKLFDPKIVSLTKVAEETNQLEKIYSKLNEQYSEEIQHKVSMLNNLMEPFLIIFVGGFVAIILVSMYLPLFQMSNSFM